MISEIYQRKFTEAGFEVFVAESGDQVLALAKKEKVDLILLDLVMPRMDGFEVIKNLRSGNYDPNLKVVVFSNLNQKEDREKALNLGADGFVSKSEYAPTALVGEIGRLLNQFREKEKNEKRENDRENGIISENSQEKADAKKILIIEDEVIFIDMFGEKLRSEGYAVDSAENGAWGLKKAIEGDYDLLVIDMMMPAMTGEEIIEKLKAEEKTKNIPIIVLSASVEDAAAKKVQDLGINAFFVKTQLIPSDLCREVNKILGTK